LDNNSCILFSVLGFGLGDIWVNSNNSLDIISNNAHPIVLVDTSSPRIFGLSFKDFFIN
jgi:hypothetical protein